MQIAITTLAIVTTLRDPRFTKQRRLLQRGGFLAARDTRAPGHLYATMIHFQQRAHSPFQFLCQQVCSLCVVALASERRKHFGRGFCGKIPEIPAKKIVKQSRNLRNLRHPHYE